MVTKSHSPQHLQRHEAIIKYFKTLPVPSELGVCGRACIRQCGLTLVTELFRHSLAAEPPAKADEERIMARLK